MKRILTIAAFIGLTTSVVFSPLSPAEQPKTAPSKPAAIAAVVHTEAVEPTPPTAVQEPTPEPTPVITWQGNPQGCTDDQWIAAEAPYNCIDKPQPTPITTPTTITPARPVAAPQTTNYGGDVASIIIKWANHYGVSADWLLRVARCESGLRADAVNYGYYAGGGNPSGLFQYLPATWVSYSAQAGLSGASILDVEAQARVTAWAFANGKSSAWECR